ncbi:uncharacterized protein LOC101241578 [Hydra vulgaris]|uniref:uncharacterized protein LOC101241578 n=1 Tax=Hydra vulgaris TaxID=6087 RepID=UPI0032EA0898
MDISVAVAEEDVYIGSSETRPRQLESGGRGQYCCVPMCKNASYDKHKNKTNFGLFTFPKSNPQLLKKWINVFNSIRRQGGVDNFNVKKKYTLVCEFHFNISDIILKPCSGRKTLHKDAIPKISKKKLPCNITTEALESGTCSNIETDINFHIEHPKENVACENCQHLKEQLEQLKKENDFLKNENLTLTIMNSKINKEIESKKQNEFNYKNISTEPKLFKSFTGLELDRFNDSSIEKKQKHSNIESMPKKGPKPKLCALDQFFMTLVYLKYGFALSHIGWLFKLPKSTISRQIISWINYLYFTLGRIPIWPSREQIDLTMPECFKITYPSTRCIIDCTELFCQIPSSLNIQSCLYSSYKSHVTYKGLLGISPSGAIIFVSQLYPGSVSDKEIVIRSGFLNKDLWDKDDSVIADRGFTIEEELENINVRLNIPSFLEGRNQFTLAEVKESQTIASVRIHIERAIQRIKRYKIIRNEITLSLHGSVNQIWTVICLLTNFQSPLINDTEKTT